MWADGMRDAELARIDYDVREQSEYIVSANEIREGAIEVRENLERDPSLGASTPSMGDAGGGSDRLCAWPPVPYARQAAYRDFATTSGRFR